VLPQLFEKTADYSELLLNVSVTDQDGVLYHLVHDIDEDDFNIEKGGSGGDHRLACISITTLSRRMKPLPC
jgi:hypothetical protein